MDFDEFSFPTQLHHRLSKVMRGLLQVLNHKGLATIILTQNLGDLIAGLIQLSFAPLKRPSKSDNDESKKLPKPDDSQKSPKTNESQKTPKPDEAQESPKTDKSPSSVESPMTVELHDKLAAEQTWFRAQLDRIAERIYQPIVTKYLLVSISTGQFKNIPILVSSIYCRTS